MIPLLRAELLRIRSRRLTWVALGAVLLVKGVFAVMVPIVCALWLISRRASTAGARHGHGAWAALAAMPLAGALLAWGYLRREPAGAADGSGDDETPRATAQTLA